VSIPEFSSLLGGIAGFFTLVIFPFLLQRRTLRVAREERQRETAADEEKRKDELEHEATERRREIANREEVSVQTLNRTLQEREEKAQVENQRLREQLDTADTERRRIARELETDYNKQIEIQRKRIQILEDELSSVRRELRQRGNGNS
jgi:CTP-dependent riboflavin kinase